MFNIVPIKATLNKHKIEYDVAQNGIIAVDRYIKHISDGGEYRLILMDLQMPIMDGYEATVKIREFEKENNYPKVYICALSAANDNESKEKTKKVGMDNYLPKPINTEQLIELIEKKV